jgi:hypothetical protein
MSKTTAPPAEQADDDDPGAELRKRFGVSRYRESTDEHARTYLTRVLTATGGDRITAAAIAGLNRTHLQALIKRHNVNVKPNLKNRGRRRTKSEAETDEPDETDSGEGEAHETSEAKAAGRINW